MGDIFSRWLTHGGNNIARQLWGMAKESLMTFPTLPQHVLVWPGEPI